MSLSVVPISSFPHLSHPVPLFLQWYFVTGFPKTTAAVFLRRHLSIYASEYWGPPWSPRLQSRRSRLPHSTSPKSMTSLIVAAKTKPPETKTGSCGAFPHFTEHGYALPGELGHSCSSLILPNPPCLHFTITPPRPPNTGLLRECGNLDPRVTVNR